MLTIAGHDMDEAQVVAYVETLVGIARHWKHVRDSGKRPPPEERDSTRACELLLQKTEALLGAPIEASPTGP